MADSAKRRSVRAAELRVLMIDTVPLVYDGIATVMLNYAAHMNRDGLRMDFLAINDAEPSIRQTIAQMGGQLHIVEGRNRHPMRYVRAVSRVVRENGYDIVHAHGNSCTLATEMLAAKLGGARVRCAHSHNTYSTSPRVHRLLRPLFEHSYTHGFACSAPAGRWLFGEKPFVVLNNGADAEKFRFNPEYRAEYRRKLGLGDRFAVGHVGRFSDQKNHAFLVDAFARSLKRDPNRALVLVGDGPNRPAIEARVREKGLSDSVIFTGVTREIPQLLSALDLMALPSLFEGLPNVLVEWQAAGLPALAADTVDPLGDMTGLVSFLPLSTEVWVDAMLAAAPLENRAAASASAIEDIARAGYDIHANAEKLRRLYFEYAGRN